MILLCFVVSYEPSCCQNHVTLPLSYPFSIDDIMINYKSYLISIFVSLAISIGLQMILPYPYGLIAAIAVFAVYPLILRNRTLSKMSGMGMGSGAGSFMQGQNLKYVCLVCNNHFKGAICSRCGSKMKRAEF